jgi:hypothetical protein
MSNLKCGKRIRTQSVTDASAYALALNKSKVTTPDYPRSEAICYRSLSQRLRRKFAQQFAQLRS